MLDMMTYRPFLKDWNRITCRSDAVHLGTNSNNKKYS